MSDQKRLPLSGDKKIRFGGRYFMDWIVLKKMRPNRICNVVFLKEGVKIKILIPSSLF